MLRYEAGAHNQEGSASVARLDAYRHARSVGEFFNLHPGPPGVARDRLGWNLAKHLRSTPGFAPPERLKSARLEEIGVVYAAMAAASAKEPWEPSSTTVYAVTAAAPRGGESEGALLTQFTEYGRLEEDASHEPLTGFLLSLAPLTPDGDGHGPWLYSDALVPAD